MKTTPKLILLHLFRQGAVLEDARDEIMLNPRRVDYFKSVAPPTQQPTLDCGTLVALGSNKRIVVRESLAAIKRLLK